jgi:phosphoribosylanthranilate isomerase
MESALKIKVCGMREPKNLEQLCSIAPDYIGYIFYSESKRFVGLRPDPALFKIPPSGITKVGVFVNEQINRVRQLVEEYHLDMVQLHGNESPLYCGKLMELEVPVIKAINPPYGSDKEDFTGVVRSLLFDSPGPGWGGTGQKFDWSLVMDQSIPVPFFLSGGIGPGDAKAIREMSQENLLGVDLNSRFELAPGLKDIGLLKDFFIEIRN